MRSLTRLSHWLLQICAIFNLATALLVVVSVVLRYVFFSPLRFTEELTGFGLLFVVFLSQSAITLKRDHIAVTLLYDRMPPAGRRIADLVSALLVAAVSLYFAWYAWIYLEPSIARSSTTDAGQLLLWPWMVPMVAGMVLNAAASVVGALAPGRREA